MPRCKSTLRLLQSRPSLSRSAPPYLLPPPPPPASSTRRSPPGRDRSVFDCTAAFASKPCLSPCWTNVQCILCCRTLRPRSSMQDGSPFATELLPENAVRCLSCKSAAPHRALLACDAWLRGKLCQRTVSPWDSFYDVSPVAALAAAAHIVRVGCAALRVDIAARVDGGDSAKGAAAKTVTFTRSAHVAIGRCSSRVQRSTVQRSAAQRCGPHSAAEL